MPPGDFTLKPEERRLYHPEAPVVRVLGLGPHKTPHFSDSLSGDEEIKISKPKLPREHSSTDYGIWTTFAFIVGLSLTQFFFNAGVGVVSKVLPDLDHPVNTGPSQMYSLSGTSTPEERLGSDDIEDAVTIQLTDETLYNLPATAKLPKLSASAYLIGDVQNGKIILESHGTTTYPFASVTKLMTALVAKQVDNLHDTATVTKKVLATYGTEGGLRLGEKIVVGDLVYPMLLESSNDAAEALAEHFGREKFITLMNQKAAAIGMFSTTFDDASGLSYKNKGSVEDLFKLSQHIQLIMPEIFDTTRVRQYQILGHTWSNHNHFLTLSTFAGGKNGYTDEAKRTSVALFKLPLSSKDGKVSQNRTLALIVLHSDNREGDIATLLNYIKRNVFLDSKATATTTTPGIGTNG